MILNLPHNKDAEYAIITHVLTEGGTAEIYDHLEPDDFLTLPAKEIFKVAKPLFLEGKTVDIVTVKDELVKKGTLKQIGGAAKLAEILDAGMYPSSIPHYIEIIKDKAKKRRLMIGFHRAFNQLSDESINLTELMKEQQELLNSVALENTGRECVLLSDMVMPAIERYEKLKKTGQVSGLSTGFPDLDEVLSGWQKCDLIIIAGRPGMGKSAFALTTALHAAYKGIPGVIFSLEMSRQQLVDRAMAGEAGVNLKKFRNGSFSVDNWGRILNVADRLKEAPLLIDDTPGLAYPQLWQKARVLKNQYNIQYVIIDYLQLMLGNERYEREDIGIARITRGLELMAKELDIPVILLSQLNRQVELRENKRPRLADLRGSGAIEQDADVIIFLYRDEFYNPETEDKNICEVNVAKQRMGPTLTVRMYWRAAITRFEPLFKGGENA